MPDSLDKQIGCAECPKCNNLITLNYTTPSYRANLTVNGKELRFDNNA